MVVLGICTKTGSNGLGKNDDLVVFGWVEDPVTVNEESIDDLVVIDWFNDSVTVDDESIGDLVVIGWFIDLVTVDRIGDFVGINFDDLAGDGLVTGDDKSIGAVVVIYFVKLDGDGLVTVNEGSGDLVGIDVVFAKVWSLVKVLIPLQSFLIWSTNRWCSKLLTQQAVLIELVLIHEIVRFALVTGLHNRYGWKFHS